MLGLIAFSLQAAYYAHVNPNSTNDPNIIVPSSSVENWYDLGKKVHTHYLINASAGKRTATPVAMNLHGPLIPNGLFGYEPSDIRAAYNVPSVGGSQAIAIVDAYDYPSALQDFNTFASTYGLPLETSTTVTASTNRTFQVVYGNGSKPSGDAGWNGEEALDIEWAHAMAPNAKIYLVEAASPAWSDFSVAINTAKALAGVKEVSMSFGGGEFSGETSLDAQLFSGTGIVFFSSAGDVGGEQEYPSESVDVVGVGGTTLQMSGNVVTSETAWSGSGGGPSSVESRPAFQSRVSAIVGSVRGTPDIAAVADPNFGVAVYEDGSWGEVGGTSVACPVCAGIVNNTATFLTSSPAQNLFFYSKLGTNTFRDITQGTAGKFSAAVGWDFITGCGTPIGLTRNSVPVVYQPDNNPPPAPITGTKVSGSLASILTANDGNTFQVKATKVTNLGSVADLQTHFTISGHLQSNILSASVTVVASANTGSATTGYVTNEVFIKNPSSGLYELVAAPTISTSDTTVTVALSQAQALKYLDSYGNFVVLTRALLPSRFYAGNNQTFTYSVDQVSATYSYSQ
jgi:subtilase family serine protease